MRSRPPAGPWAGTRPRPGRPGRRGRGQATTKPLPPQSVLGLSCERSYGIVRGRRYCLPRQTAFESMMSTIRQHEGAALVAAAVVIAAFAQGLFDATGYAAASIV